MWYSEYPFVDAHCDTLSVLEEQNRRLGQRSSTGHVDLPRLLEGGIGVQFFAAFVNPSYRENSLIKCLELLDVFYRELEECPHLELILNRRDVDRLVKPGRVAAVLSVEGGESLNGSLGVLRTLYRLGVRSLTLTWNYRNELGDGVLEDGPGGLTEFGVAVVKEMNRLGMLVDASHLSEGAFWDVLSVSSYPVIVSHANCRSLCDHPRNLTDDQIRALAGRGGVLGLSFVPEFVGGKEAGLEKFLDHVDHVVSLVGVDHVGLGSDFDGTASTVLELQDASKLPLVRRGLIERGYSKEEIVKIMGKNILQLISRVLR